MRAALREAGPPAILGLAGLVLWQALVGLFHVPASILPGPIVIAAPLFRDAGCCSPR